MRRRNTCLLMMLIVALASGAVFGVALVRRWRSERERMTVYEAVLRHAPCVETVCPGFDQGREQAVQVLGRSGYVRANVQGTSDIGLDIVDGQGNSIGSGIIRFTVDDPSSSAIRYINFGLFGLRLGSTFSILGEPDTFLFVSGCGMGRRVHADLYYQSRGVRIIIEYETWRPASQVLTARTPVRAIEYFQPAQYDEHVSSALKRSLLDSVAYDLDSSVTATDFIAQFRPWPGLAASPTPSADFCPRR